MRNTEMYREGIVGEFLQFQIRRQIINLFKKELELNEDLKRQHDDMIQKIKNSVPSEYHKIIDAANYYTDKRTQDVRKIILDAGNDAIKEMLSTCEKFNYVGLNGNLDYNK